MSMQINSTDDFFLQRLDDLAVMCRDRYCPQYTGFLDGRSLACALEYLKRYSEDVITVSFGGFENAERRVVGLFPKDVFGLCDARELTSEFDLCGVEIKGSGFSTFSHRDCMGSVLGLGIKRESVGDIYVSEDGKSAYLCSTRVVAEYLRDNLSFVARDKVKLSVIDSCDLPVPVKKYCVISGTVASERLDCIVAMCTNLSREKAKQLIASGFVNVNHFEQIRPDVVMCENDIISIRGFGRFVVIEFSGITRKGRNRIVIHKMI